MSRRKQQASLLIAFSMAVTAMATALAAGSIASPLDQFEPWPVLNMSTTKAASSPKEFTIGMVKERSGCRNFNHPEHDFETGCAYNPMISPPFLGEPLNGETSGLYLQQDLKDMKISLPAGLVASPKAVSSFCGLRTTWVPDSRDPSKELKMKGCAGNDSLVGSVDITSPACFEVGGMEKRIQVICPHPEGMPAGAAVAGLGAVHWEEPGPGEAARLVVLWPIEGEDTTAGVITSYVTMTVRAADLGIDAMATEIPSYYQELRRPIECGEEVDESDPYCEPVGSPLAVPVPAQVSDIIMTLDGQIGQERGLPLLKNSTDCKASQFDFQFMGWAYNSFERMPEGDGETVQSSLPYAPEDCGSVPYSPKLGIDIDNSPGRDGQFKGSLTQGRGEATTERVQLVFSKGYKINVLSKAADCSAEQLKEERCPAASRIGQAKASALGLDLEGPVYLTSRIGKPTKIEAVLTGRAGKQDLKVPIKATADLSEKLDKVIVTFDSLPKVPVDSFSLNLDGGPNALLKTDGCVGQEPVAAKFTSHSGKVVESTVNARVTGCPVEEKAKGSFKASLSRRKPGKKTRLKLKLSSPDASFDSVNFGIAKGLVWGFSGRKVSKRSRREPVGTVTVRTDSGKFKTQIGAKPTKLGVLRIKAIGPRKAKGKVGASQLPKLRGTLRKAGKLSTLTVPGGSVLTISGLPQDGVTDMEVNLGQKGSRFLLKISRRCIKKPLTFTARAMTADGPASFKDSVKLARCRKNRRA